MSEEKEKITVDIIELSKKVCSRTKDHASRTRPEIPFPDPKKIGHSGLRFNVTTPKKKLTVVKPFSFDTGPKIKKENRCPTLEKPAGTQVNRKETHKGARKEVTVTMECLKVKKEIQSITKARSVSWERTPKSPEKKPFTRCTRATKETTVTHSNTRPTSTERRPRSPKSDHLSEKKACTRCSRAAKEGKATSNTRSISRERSPKPEASTPKAPKNEDAHIKKLCTRCSRHAKSEVPSAKPETSPLPAPRTLKPPSSNATKSQGKCLKASSNSETKTVHAVKAEVHFSSVDKSETKTVIEKSSSNTEVSKSEISKNADAGSRISGIKKPSDDESRLSHGVNAKPDNEIKFESLNGVGVDPETGSLNGVEFECDNSNIIKILESGMQKNSSKIPRKKLGPDSGLKIPTSLKEEITASESFSYDMRCSNFKKEIMHSETNQVQMANAVIN